MIEKLTIENYKSFGDKTEIELGKFNVLFEKKEGKTTCRKIENPEEMKERVIKDIPLGEVWCSGEIGGVP